MAEQFCNLPMALAGERGAGLYQWPMGTRLTWTVVQTIPGFSQSELTDVCREAWKAWDDICGITIDWTADPSRANILIGCRPIDGQYGVLAEAELPVGNVNPSTQLRVWIDNTDKFVAAENPPSGRIDLLRVIRHEFGHSLGIGHNQDGVTNSLMDPTVSNIRTLQSWDIEQAVLRYGKQTSTTPVPSNDFAAFGKEFLDMLAKMSPASRAMILERLK